MNYDNQYGSGGEGGGAPAPPPHWQQYPPPVPPAYYGYSPGFPPPPPPPQYYGPHRKRLAKPIRRNANAVCACLLVLLALLVFSYVPLYSLARLLPEFLRINYTYAVEMTISIVAYTIAFAVPLCIVVPWLRIPLRVAFPMKRSPKPSIAIAAVCFCLGLSIAGGIVSNMISVVLDILFGVTPYMGELDIPVTGLDCVLFFIDLAILPAIFEELFFRGVVLQSLRRFGDGFALAVSSILFGMCHGNLVQMPNTLIVGLAIGYFVLRTGSLKVGMLMHFANNGIVSVFTIWTRGLDETQYMVANLTLTIVYIVLGIGSLVYLLLRHAKMFQVAPSAYPLSTARKYVSFFTSAMPILFIIAVVVLTVLFLE